MFTGIVQSQARVLLANTTNQLLKLRVCAEKSLIDGLQLGASVANNGVCLTAVAFDYIEQGAYIDFDVIDETLRLTNLGELTVGDMVNIERSLKIGDEIGGHMVSGHVHCCAITSEVIKTETNCQIRFNCPTDKLKYILSKGFITINGTSLTVGEVSDVGFTVHLIPETLTRTNLGTLQVNDRVNIEFDQQTITIVDTIERMQLQNQLLMTNE